MSSVIQMTDLSRRIPRRNFELWDAALRAGMIGYSSRHE